MIILYSASILANCVWWVLSPNTANVFIQWANLDSQDKVTGYINNRYPFGVITVAKPKEKERPKVVDQLKLTGVYLNTPKDSFAFLEYQGKPTIVRIGAEIGTSGATVKSIGSDSIVIFADDQDSTIKVTNGVATQAGSSPLSQGQSFGGSSNPNPDTMFGSRGGSNVQNNDNSSSSSSNSSIEDFRQQRRKILEELRSKNHSTQSTENPSGDGQ